MVLNSGKLDKYRSTIGKKFFAIAGATVLTCVAAPLASAGVLGPASGYNIFTLNNLTMSNTDVGGSVAVGGNALLTNYTLNSNLIVNGNFTNTNATLSGAGIINGNVDWTTPTIPGSLTSNGSINFHNNGGSSNSAVKYLTTYTGPSYIAHTAITSPVSLPVDFSTAATALAAISSSAAALPVNGSTVNAFNTITFTGTDPSLNVFALTLADLQVSTGFHFSVPSGSTTIVNVLGSGSAVLPNTGFQGEQDNLLLWNFNAYSNLTMGSFDGSILAPSVNIIASSGGVNGQIIANSITGGSNGSDEFHNVLFTGDFGLGNGRVPEPASLGLIVLGALALIRRRHAHR